MSFTDKSCNSSPTTNNLAASLGFAGDVAINSRGSSKLNSDTSIMANSVNYRHGLIATTRQFCKLYDYFVILNLFQDPCCKYLRDKILD